MKAVVFCMLWLVGLFAAMALGIWLLAGFLYVFSDVSDPGPIASIPKVIFPFSLLLLLGKTRSVRIALNQTAEQFLPSDRGLGGEGRKVIKDTWHG